MNDQLTPWFDGSTKPARKGVYQRCPFKTNAYWYSYFDGRFWHVGASCPIAAYAFYRKRDVSLTQHPPWRGLAQKP